jgi:hypothetical protein
MASLAYMTKRGAGVVYYGTCADLGKRMIRLKTSAILRSNHGVIVGEVRECDGGCDAPCPGNGWHCWYDSTGDEAGPDEGGLGHDADIVMGY